MDRRGGKRPGAGRPRNQNLTIVPPSVAAEAKPGVVDGAVPDPPTSLGETAAIVWRLLAPLAHAEATLTPATVMDFAATCELAVEAQGARIAVSRTTPGSEEWVPVSRLYLAYQRDLAVKLRAFRLAPNGLPMVKADTTTRPKSALEKMRAKRLTLVGGQG